MWLVLSIVCRVWGGGAQSLCDLLAVQSNLDWIIDGYQVDMFQVWLDRYVIQCRRG